MQSNPQDNQKPYTSRTNHFLIREHPRCVKPCTCHIKTRFSISSSPRNSPPTIAFDMIPPTTIHTYHHTHLPPYHLPPYTPTTIPTYVPSTYPPMYHHTHLPTHLRMYHHIHLRDGMEQPHNNTYILCTHKYVRTWMKH